jgi:hypothetical protein
MCQLRQMSQHPFPRPGPPLSRVDRPGDHGSTQVPAATREVAPPIDMDKTQVIPAIKDGDPQITLVPSLKTTHTRNSSPMA